MEISTLPTDFPPSWSGGRNYQVGSGMITGIQNRLQRREIKDAEDASEKHMDTNSTTVMVRQPWGRKFLEKWIAKCSRFSDGHKLLSGIELGWLSLLKWIAKRSPFSDVHKLLSRIELSWLRILLTRKFEDGKDAPKKHIDSTVTICQPEFKKPGIVNGSSSDGSERNNAPSPAEDPNLRFKVASRDLKSVSLLGKGFSGIVYETIWKKERRCARKDFVRVPSAVFEREIEVLVRLKYHSNVVQTIGWAVAKNCCSLVLELMDCSLRSLAQRRKLLRRVTNSEPHIDSTSTLDSGCSNSPETPQVFQHEIEKKMNKSYSPVITSCEAQTSSPFSIVEVIQIITAIAAGMKYLHDNKVVHGDLKPGNILVTLKKCTGSSNSFDESLEIETVKVADFGVIESKSRSRSMTSVSLETREVDRIRWKAPELFDIGHGLKQDFGALALGDVYSFGMTALEILSGEEPYSDYQNSGAKTLQELILKGTRPDLPELPARCQPLTELIRWCWDCEPTKRPNFGSIVEELQKIRVALSPATTLGPSSSKKIPDLGSPMKEATSRHAVNERPPSDIQENNV